jgi:PleD family two-component response regulator
MRPDDAAAHNGDAEFLVLLPKSGGDVAVGVLERVRERLALALASGTVPSFTATFGVAPSACAADFEGLVAIADGALQDARAAGNNRVVVAALPDLEPHPANQL